MVYDYICDDCGHEFQLVTTISKRDEPLDKPCPSCSVEGKVRRLVGAPAVSYQGGRTMQQRAGSEWNNVLKGIKKAAGRQSTIETN